VALRVYRLPLRTDSSDVELQWWPEFERDFALYMATIPPGRDGAAAMPTRLRRPPARD
jgi:hypothetical protein